MSYADTFRQLHQSGFLRLANAWDAGSARLIESLGARALATTSGGVAWANGYPDGDALPVSRLLASVRAMTRVLRVPLSVDIEGGYSDDPATVGDHIAAVLDAGAVGINIEDGGGDPGLLCAKIEAAKAAAARCGVDLFVNARTDVYLRGLGDPAQRVELVLERARHYRQAGADGLFVPGLSRRDDIGAVAGACAMPLNVMSVPDLPSADTLQALGVRRLSAGTALSQALYARLAALATGFLEDRPAGDDVEITYPTLNALFPHQA